MSFKLVICFTYSAWSRCSLGCASLRRKNQLLITNLSSLKRRKWPKPSSVNLHKMNTKINFAGVCLECYRTAIIEIDDTGKLILTNELDLWFHEFPSLGFSVLLVQLFICLNCTLNLSCSYEMSFMIHFGINSCVFFLANLFFFTTKSQNCIDFYSSRSVIIKPLLELRGNLENLYKNFI